MKSLLLATAALCVISTASLANDLFPFVYGDTIPGVMDFGQALHYAPAADVTKSVNFCDEAVSPAACASARLYVRELHKHPALVDQSPAYIRNLPGPIIFYGD